MKYQRTSAWHVLWALPASICVWLVTAMPAAGDSHAPSPTAAAAATRTLSASGSATASLYPAPRVDANTPPEPLPPTF